MGPVASGGIASCAAIAWPEALYDATVAFCDLSFARLRARTTRWCRRLGAQPQYREGSGAAATSRKSEMKLTNVAWLACGTTDSGLHELLRRAGCRSGTRSARSAENPPRAVTRPSRRLSGSGVRGGAETAANTCSAPRTSHLPLRRHARSPRARFFLANGGFTSGSMAARFKARQSDRSDRSDSRERAPACPLCGKAMRRREARTGPHAGEPFWGCGGWPECRGLLPIKGESDMSDTSDPSDKKRIT